MHSGFLREPITITNQKWNKSVIPLVSISCITYNHENYIRDAIEGFLMQKTTFPVEILIHDDASTDKTPEIIHEYEQRFPDLIFPIFQKENQYSKGIGVTRVYQFPRAKGKYIAMCEGDDYWTDPYKLQKLMDFMEANQDFSLCFHNSIIKYNQKKIKDKLFCDTTIPEISNTYDLINKFSIPTASIVFRKASLIIPEWFHYVYNGDYALALLISLNGKTKYISEVMSVYRKTSGGLNSKIKNSIVWFKIYEMLSYFDLYTHFNFHEEIVKRKEGLRDMIEISLSSEKSVIEKVLSFEYWQNKFRKFIFII